MNQELEQIQVFYNTMMEFFAEYSVQIIGAIIILLFGLWIAGRVAKAVDKLCLRKKLDVTLSHFIASVVKAIIMIGVGIICLQKLGISITPFIAAVGAISLGAGLAVQGLLSNYGSGLNIILTRLFVVGDTITVQGVTGLVKEVRLAYTVLEDEDEVTILVPNRHIVGEILHNSGEEKLVDATVGVAYSSDIELVKRIITEVIEKHGATNRALKIGIDEFGDSSINIGLRYWVPTDKFHQTRMAINDDIYTELKRHNVTIPFPQREVRLLDKG